jgi:hypothetical protein
MSETPEDPKIIVDEDWKERVRAEREAAREKKRTQSPDSPSGTDQAAEPDAFTLLVSSLATQAMMALGQLPDIEQGHAVVRPELAKQPIDTLAMLEEKTKGNLTVAEEKMLSEILHQLRMLFLSVYRGPDSEAQAAAEKGNEAEVKADQAEGD